MLIDLLNETKGFKYHITVKNLLKNYELNKEIECTPVYLNSLTKTVINHRFKLESSFPEILYMNDLWINKGSGYGMLNRLSLNILTFRPIDRCQEVLMWTYLLN